MLKGENEDILIKSHQNDHQFSIEKDPFEPVIARDDFAAYQEKLAHVDAALAGARFTLPAWVQPRDAFIRTFTEPSAHLADGA